MLENHRTPLMSGRRTNRTRLTLPVLILVLAAAVRAEVRLPAIISDNMVLQQGMKVRIWGNAKAGERVSVAFDKQTSSTVADTQGHWQVLIGPLKAGGPAELT